MVNKNQLKGLMVASGLTCEEFAQKMGMSRQALYAKLSGRTAFTLAQAEKAQEILGIKDEDFAFYFLSHERPA